MSTPVWISCEMRYAQRSRHSAMEQMHHTADTDMDRESVSSLIRQQLVSFYSGPLVHVGGVDFILGIRVLGLGNNSI